MPITRSTLGALIALAAAFGAVVAAAGAPHAKFTVYKKWPFDAAEAKRRQLETAKALGVETQQDFVLAPGVKITMVLIPAGEFLMGSAVSAAEVARLTGRRLAKANFYEHEHPQHRVVIRKPFWMAKCELTQAQWKAVMGSNPSDFKGDRNPVERVSWNDTQELLKRVNARGKGPAFVLPTEAQWEYACRAGTATPFHFGQALSTDQANYDGNHTYGRGRQGVFRQRTTPVGALPANAWGLHDMHGNVWEWCASPYAERYDGSESKHAGAPGRLRVLRGGSWSGYPQHCRSAVRLRCDPTRRIYSFGCRLSRAISGSRSAPPIHDTDPMDPPPRPADRGPSREGVGDLLPIPTPGHSTEREGGLREREGS